MTTATATEVKNRFGEYIETSGAKGTVEKISIRSVSLRHQRGALATIPYGQIGKIQNFSRDWMIEKLTFRVAFNTDVEKVRKIFKKIGQEMLATAIKLAKEHGAIVEALHVIRVPLELPLDAELLDEEERAEAALAEARLLGAENGVKVVATTLRARSIGTAIVEHARATRADLIVVGSSPRWRRQSRFFSPTVDYLLRTAPAEVLIVAFPQRVMDEELAAT